jgi:hypothetical protein
MKRVAIACTLLGCHPAADTASTVPEAGPAPADLPPSKHAAGEQLDLRVPLAQGGMLDLAALRGKVVLLELVDAAHVDPQQYAAYREVWQRAGDALAIVIVSLDQDPATDDAFVYGTDPQGALAARLHAARLPMVIVLDREGRVVQQYAGDRDANQPAALEAIRTLLGG